MELEFVRPNDVSGPLDSHSINNKNAMMNEDTTNAPIISSLLSSTSHPTICLFHILFKILSFISYMFGPLFFHFFSKNSFILSFSLTIILLSLDFWTVKNVTGRILVRMRWWYEISKDGETIWMFETDNNQNEMKNGGSSSTDRSIFWGVTYIWTLIWISIFILQLISLKLKWMSLSIIAITLSSTNLIGYTRCAGSSQSNQRDWITNLAIRTIVNNTQNMV
ncbi:FAM18-like protein [Cryptosporidium ryanae]|uniref:FAM18-like protein n=1 Tax=Cryptosporidium ryanae TaxID=515981 RepID=UPI00351A41D6|nr:FAM18-like protein [Cryptosporidium ryanae]